MAEPSQTKWHFLQFLGVATCLSQPAIGQYMGVVGTHASAALIPYIVALVLVATPVVFVQLYLGSRSSCNVMNLLSRHCAILRGVGIVCLIRNFVWSTILSVQAARMAVYFGQSFTKPFAWGRCDSFWNRDMCDVTNSSLATDLRSPEMQYMSLRVMRMSSSISEEGTIPTLVLVCLLAAWVATFLLSCGGARAFGWLMFVFGQCGVVLAVGLFAFGWEEFMAARTTAALYNTDWTAFTRPQQAAGLLSAVLQVLSSATFLWTGVLPTLGKYAGDSKTARYTSWIPLLVLALLIPHVFLHLFHIYLMAAADRVGLPKPLHKDPMVGMTWAFRILDVNRGVAVSFFTMVLICYIQTLALVTWVCVENIHDGMVLWQRKSAKNPRASRMLIAAVICISGAGFAMPMITQAGPYLFNLVSSFLDVLLPIFMIFSLVAYAFAFMKWKGIRGLKIALTVWLVCACLILVGFDSYRVVWHMLETGGQVSTRLPASKPYHYPLWAYILGWLVASGPLLVGLVFGALHALGAAKGGKLKILRNKLIQGRRSINSFPFITVIPFITVKRREKPTRPPPAPADEDDYMTPANDYETISAGSRLDAHMLALANSGFDGMPLTGPKPAMLSPNQFVLETRHVMRNDGSRPSSNTGVASIHSSSTFQEEPTRQRPSYLLY